MSDVLSDYLHEPKKCKIPLVNAQEASVVELFVSQLFDDAVNWVANLHACISVPAHVVIAAEFAKYLERHGAELWRKVHASLLAQSSTVLICQPEWILLCRVANFLYQPEYSECSRLLQDSLWGVLTKFEASMERDVVTQTAQLLVRIGFFENEKISILTPIPQMALYRYLNLVGKTQLFMALADGQCGMQLHYAIQSILLCGVDDEALVMVVVNLAFRFWDHPWQMVATHCRALFLQLVQQHVEYRARIADMCFALPAGSKRKFNALFALAQTMSIDCSDSLLAEIVGSLSTGSASAAGASQLLQTLLTQNPALIHQLAICAEGDPDLLYGAVVGSAHSLKQMKLLVIHPLTQMKPVHALLPHAAAEGLLRIEDQNLLFANKKVDCFEGLRARILSGSSAVVTNTVSTLLRAKLWPELVGQFIREGGLAVVGCCNDDRAVLVQDFAHFFSAKNANYDLLFELVLAALEGSVLEEGQLSLEVLLAMARRKQLETKTEKIPTNLTSSIHELLDKSLRSRWNPMRVLAQKLILYRAYTPLGADWISATDEWRGVWFDSLAENEAIEFVTREIKGLFTERAMLALATVANATRIAPDLLDHCLAVMVDQARFIGEPLEGTNALYKVDCRGHPIMSSEAESVGVSNFAWTSIKSASMCIAKMLNYSDVPIEKVGHTLSTLLLALKHPAAIGPVHTCFLVFARKYPHWVETKIVLPLVSSITEDTNSISLPVALRRSQGLGPLILACLLNSPTLLEYTVKKLLDFLRHFRISPILIENCLHCLNVLRAIVRDTNVHERVLEPFIAAISEEALAILEMQSDWRLRSSATQLFVHAVRRVIGADHLGNKRVSGRDFFNRSNSLEAAFHRILAGNSESLQVTVLSVLASLGELDDILLRALHVLMTESASPHVRRLAKRHEGKQVSLPELNVVSNSAVTDPVLRVQLADLMSEDPAEVPVSVALAASESWGTFVLGLAALALWLEEWKCDPVDFLVRSWLRDAVHNVEGFCLVVKQRLAKSQIVRDSCVDLHALLMLDEDPEVRQAASSELNPVEAFRRIAPKCSDTLLNYLLQADDEYGSYCIRVAPRKIAQLELGSRNSS